MTRNRSIQRLIKSRPTIEGAGVHLKRVFGFGNEAVFDPFLLLDDFRSEDPRYFLPGFPWHPHRGIETITYILDGTVEHGDSLGNKGVIGPGDIQWMTAGSGIIHQEMPQGDSNGVMGGFQLWANLPASQKMMDPRYRDVKSDQIPEISPAVGVKIRIISGVVNGVKGPVRDIVIDPEYLDISVSEHNKLVLPTKPGHTVFAYVIGGRAFFCEDKPPISMQSSGAYDVDLEKCPEAKNTELVLFDDGDRLTVITEETAVRFILISGKPLGEPIAWYGPIVMNTDDELQVAFDEYRRGTFIKHRPVQ
jgi:quercetin 2,3-dioxygenase